MLTPAEEVGLMGLRIANRVQAALDAIPKDELTALIKSLHHVATERHLTYDHDGVATCDDEFRRVRDNHKNDKDVEFSKPVKMTVDGLPAIAFSVHYHDKFNNDEFAGEIFAIDSNWFFSVSFTSEGKGSDDRGWILLRRIAQSIHFGNAK